MARTTPRVEQEVLVLPEDKRASVQAGSQRWYSWLADEKNGSFFFVNETGSFTARKERQTETVQRFLLATAPLTELTPALCTAMGDDPGHQGSEAYARSLLDWYNFE